ncbi:MAG: type II toxin-antitoxin system RelE/ParE family toxin [Rudaea sp.]|uniref:type II toxin-antitoxin system RelE/ParE family toxin n=1 Tax=Rudaea sp. TaxID=2136325 RepID=UPI0039E5AA71
MTPTLQVHFYAAASGNEPVRDWLRTLKREDRKSIGEDIKTAQFGWPLGMPLVRKMEPGLWEIRSRITHGTARILFTVSGSTMVLLHGFAKKSAKTPAADLKVAKQRRSEVHNG